MMGARRERYSDGHTPEIPIGGRVKRAFDIAVASTVLLLFSPLILTVAALIWVTQRNTVIFKHERIGFSGRKFYCYKFCTMVPNADGVLRDYLASNSEAANEWRENQKLKHDPRVTFLGHIMRKSSIDELPQLLNVLKGDMSCVGPRPIVDSEVERYGADMAHYMRARPGISGLWQVSGRNSLTYDARVALDAHYVRNWSFLTDVVILLKTIPAVMRPASTS